MNGEPARNAVSTSWAPPKISLVTVTSSPAMVISTALEMTGLPSRALSLPGHVAIGRGQSKQDQIRLWVPTSSAMAAAAAAVGSCSSGVRW